MGGRRFRQALLGRQLRSRAGVWLDNTVRRGQDIGVDRASPVAPHRATPAELKAQLEASRVDAPFLIYRDGANVQRIIPLSSTLERMTVGRRVSNDVPLEWDIQVSRVHAALERLGDDWTVSDDGLSSNGTFVNGVRIRGRRRLRDGDELKVGTTVIAFRAPARGASGMTFVPEHHAAAPHLGESQRAVLVALARPYKDSSGFATPARNKDIAAEVVLTVNGVKSIMRALFQKFAVEDLPQNEKRARLVERALQIGAISSDDL
jgi:pSer/pThr/pTyr-binding forkhead associated (FHA) protein